MPRSQKNENFLDKTFTILADIILRIVPMAPTEKEAFAYYRDGVICMCVYFFFYYLQFLGSIQKKFFDYKEKKTKAYAQ